MSGNKVCGAYVVGTEAVVNTCLEDASETPVTHFPEDEL